MRMVYLAHRLGAKRHDGSVDHLGILQNIRDAKLWFKWACDNYWPDYAFNMTWVMNCEVYNDADATDRERGMQRNYAHIKRCDELWLLGPVISEGMEDEARFTRRCGLPVYNLITAGLDPSRCPRFPPEDFPAWKADSLSQQALKFPTNKPPGV